MELAPGQFELRCEYADYLASRMHAYDLARVQYDIALKSASINPLTKFAKFLIHQLHEPESARRLFADFIAAHPANRDARDAFRAMFPPETSE